MADLDGMRVKPWTVEIRGRCDRGTFHGTSRGKVIADAWRSDAFLGTSFKEFLKVVSCRRAEPCERYGERFTIGGRPARYVSHDTQYVQFVWEGGDTVFNTHPLDIDQPHARRGTPYHEDQTDA